MKAKILIIIAVLAILPATYSAGLKVGKMQARQECIDTVNENCEYICGVGADFYFPDKEKREYDSIDDLEEDSMVAKKSNKSSPLL